MARTDPLTAALLLSHPHHHKHHHPKVKVPAQAEFHIGNFHHHITGGQIGYGLIAIVAIVALVFVLAGVRWLLFS